MRSWLTWLVRERLTDIALALALGTALLTLAETLTNVFVSALAQHVGRNPYAEDGSVTGLFDLFSGQYYFNVSLGGTVIVYGQVLSAVTVLGLLALVAVVVVRRRDRELGVCPFCASRIPHESRHCAYCGSSVTPGEP